MVAYRNSQLVMRRQCPYAYKRSYLDRIEGLPSPPLIGGQNVHSALNHAVRQYVRDGYVDVHDAAYRTVRGGAVEYADALVVLTRWQEALGTEFEIDPEAVFLLEERLAMPLDLPNGETVEFGGTPDLGERLDKRTCRITDWKTHWRPESEEEFEADQQLPRYALLIHYHFPRFTRFELVKRFVRWRNASHTRLITVDDLDGVRLRLASEIQAQRQMDEAGEFPATPGSWCALCAHHAACPRIQAFREHGIDDVSIEDDDRARRLAGDAIALDEAAATLKAHLKPYLTEHPAGHVAVAGGTFGFGPVQHREISAAELEQVLMSRGVEPPAELFNVDLQQLDRLTKRLPEDVVAAIEAITHRYESSQMRYRRVADVPSTRAEDLEPAEDLL